MNDPLHFNLWIDLYIFYVYTIHGMINEWTRHKRNERERDSIHSVGSSIGMDTQWTLEINSNDLFD